MIPVAKPFLDEHDAQRAYDTIMSGWVTQGPRVEEFEKQFAAYVGTKEAVAVSNCTTALHLSLIVAGIQRGDEVICPSLSYIATANSIVHAGATPVFAEVVPHTQNLDPDDVERRITANTRGILLVHQVGFPADIDAFKRICTRHNLILIEDAACAIGSQWKNVPIGKHSDFVCFSFHPRKIITTGDGGMITTDNEEYAKRLRRLRQHGMTINPLERHKSARVLIEEHAEIGYNYRMTDLQASVGIGQLEKLPLILAERRKIAERYNDAFKSIPHIRVLHEENDVRWNFQSYCVYIAANSPITRNELMSKLLEAGVSTRRGIMTAHREPAYKSAYPSVSLPISEDISDRSMILPLYFPMAESDIETVVSLVTKHLYSP